MIPSFDYRPGYLALEEEIHAAIRRVLASGQLVLGPEVHAFEQEFAAWLGLPAAVGVASGTDALIVALRVLGIGPDDEVITVANGPVAPVAAIRAVGATPRFVDVRPDTLLMDPDGLEAARTSRTRGVMPVHLYGQAVELEPVLAFARRHALRVIEDCAQAHGCRYRGRPVGGFGDLGCFSFYPTKNLGAFGDGGAVVSTDPALAERVRMQRQYGFRDDRHARCEGLNSRLDELQAAILRVKLRHLDDALAARRRLADHYTAGLAGTPYRIPRASYEATHAHHLFVVQAPERARALAALERAGIGYGIHYPIPIHRMDAYRFLGLAAGALPQTERAAASVLSLPLYPGLEAEAVDRVVETLRAAG